MLVAPFFDLQAVFHKLIILIIQKLGTPTQQQYCIAPKIYTDYLSLVRIRIEAFLSTSIMASMDSLATLGDMLPINY